MATLQNPGGTYYFGDMATPSDPFSSELMKVMIRQSRSTVEVPATYGNPTGEQKPGTPQWEMDIEFLGNPDESESFINLLLESAIDDGEIAFDVVLRPGAASATNPRYRGFITITDLELGAAVNEIWQQGVTYPITDLSISYE